MMTRTFTILFAAASLTSFGQVAGDINGDGCVQLNDLLTFLISYGNCGVDESPWQCGEPFTHQGYHYETVLVGEQCWFAENLTADKYANGDNIAMPANSDEWHDMADLGMTTWYHHIEAAPGSYNICPDFTFYDETPAHEMKSIFGNLYNQAAVDDLRGVCPNGWHVPSAIEWDMASSEGALDLASSDGVDVQWCVGSGGGGGSGLNIKPAGSIDSFSWGFYYYAAGWNAYFWTTTQLNEFTGWNSDSRIVVTRGYFNYPIIPNTAALTADYADGHSVRCVKDAE